MWILIVKLHPLQMCESFKCVFGCVCKHEWLKQAHIPPFSHSKWLEWAVTDHRWKRCGLKNRGEEGGSRTHTLCTHTHTGSQAQQRVGHICPWCGSWSAKREEEYTGIGRRRERARKHMWNSGGFGDCRAGGVWDQCHGELQQQEENPGQPYQQSPH